MQSWLSLFLLYATLRSLKYLKDTKLSERLKNLTGLLILVPLLIQICNIGYTFIGKVLMRVIIVGMMLAWYWWWVEVAWFDKMFRGATSRVFRSVETQGETYNGGEEEALQERLLNISFERVHEEENLLRILNENNTP